MLPQILIIGTQKGGTTSLFRYLTQNPRISSSTVGKEVHYFDKKIREGADYSDFFSGQEYEIDATPIYLFHEKVPERVAKYYADCARDLPLKIIALLRNPVDRAWSHYWHERGLDKESEDFKSAIIRELRLKIEDKIKPSNPEIYSHYTYLHRGFYSEQLERWLKLWSSDDIKVIASERFFNRPEQVMNEIYDFLDVPLKLPTSYATYLSQDYPEMDDGSRRLLNSLYSYEYVKLLETTNQNSLDFDIGWWFGT